MTVLVLLWLLLGRYEALRQIAIDVWWVAARVVRPLASRAENHGLAQESLDGLAAQTLLASLRTMRALRWFGKNAGVVVAAGGIAATLFVASLEVSANRDAANRRAQVERTQEAAQAADQLRLAAVSVVLDAPSCDAAIARALLATAVLGDKLPSNFVERVREIRSGSFTAASLLTKGSNFDVIFTSKGVVSSVLRDTARARAEARKTCRALAAGR